MADTIFRYIEQGDITLDMFPENLRDEPEIVFAFCVTDASYMAHASPRLKNSKAFAMQLANNKLNCMEYLSPRLRDDRELVLRTVRNNGYALEAVSDRLKADHEVLEASRAYFARETNPDMIPYAIRDLIY